MHGIFSDSPGELPNSLRRLEDSEHSRNLCFELSRDRPFQLSPRPLEFLLHLNEYLGIEEPPPLPCSTSDDSQLFACNGYWSRFLPPVQPFPDLSISTLIPTFQAFITKAALHDQGSHPNTSPSLPESPCRALTPTCHVFGDTPAESFSSESAFHVPKCFSFETTPTHTYPIGHTDSHPSNILFTSEPPPEEPTKPRFEITLGKRATTARVIRPKQQLQQDWGLPGCSPEKDISQSSLVSKSHDLEGQTSGDTGTQQESRTDKTVSGSSVQRERRTELRGEETGVTVTLVRIASKRTRKPKKKLVPVEEHSGPHKVFQSSSDGKTGIIDVSHSQLSSTVDHKSDPLTVIDMKLTGTRVIADANLEDSNHTQALLSTLDLEEPGDFSGPGALDHIILSSTSHAHDALPDLHLSLRGSNADVSDVDVHLVEGISAEVKGISSVNVVLDVIEDSFSATDPAKYADRHKQSEPVLSDVHSVELRTNQMPWKRHKTSSHSRASQSTLTIRYTRLGVMRDIDCFNGHSLTSILTQYRPDEPSLALRPLAKAAHWLVDLLKRTLQGVILLLGCVLVGLVICLHRVAILGLLGYFDLASTLLPFVLILPLKRMLQLLSLVSAGATPFFHKDFAPSHTFNKETYVRALESNTKAYPLYLSLDPLYRTLFHPTALQQLSQPSGLFDTPQNLARTVTVESMLQPVVDYMLLLDLYDKYGPPEPTRTRIPFGSTQVVQDYFEVPWLDNLLYRELPLFSMTQQDMDSLLRHFSPQSSSQARHHSIPEYGLKQIQLSPLKASTYSLPLNTCKGSSGPIASPGFIGPDGTSRRPLAGEYLVLITGIATSPQAVYRNDGGGECVALASYSTGGKSSYDTLLIGVASAMGPSKNQNTRSIANRRITSHDLSVLTLSDAAGNIVRIHLPDSNYQIYCRAKSPTFLKSQPMEGTFQTCNFNDLVIYYDYEFSPMALLDNIVIEAIEIVDDPDIAWVERTIGRIQRPLLDFWKIILAEPTLVERSLEGSQVALQVHPKINVYVVYKSTEVPLEYAHDCYGDRVACTNRTVGVDEFLAPYVPIATEYLKYLSIIPLTSSGSSKVGVSSFTDSHFAHFHMQLMLSKKTTLDALAECWSTPHLPNSPWIRVLLHLSAAFRPKRCTVEQVQKLQSTLKEIESHLIELEAMQAVHDFHACIAQSSTEFLSRSIEKLRELTLTYVLHRWVILIVIFIVYMAKVKKMHRIVHGIQNYLYVHPNPQWARRYPNTRRLLRLYKWFQKIFFIVSTFIGIGEVEWVFVLLLQVGGFIFLAQFLWGHLTPLLLGIYLSTPITRALVAYVIVLFTSGHLLARVYLGNPLAQNFFTRRVLKPLLSALHSSRHPVERFCGSIAIRIFNILSPMLVPLSISLIVGLARIFASDSRLVGLLEDGMVMIVILMLLTNKYNIAVWLTVTRISMITLDDLIVGKVFPPTSRSADSNLQFLATFGNYNDEIQFLYRIVDDAIGRPHGGGKASRTTKHRNRVFQKQGEPARTMERYFTYNPPFNLAITIPLNTSAPWSVFLLLFGSQPELFSAPGYHGTHVITNIWARWFLSRTQSGGPDLSFDPYSTAALEALAKRRTKVAQPAVSYECNLLFHMGYSVPTSISTIPHSVFLNKHTLRLATFIPPSRYLCGRDLLNPTMEVRTDFPDLDARPSTIMTPIAYSFTVEPAALDTVRGSVMHKIVRFFVSPFISQETTLARLHEVLKRDLNSYPRLSPSFLQWDCAAFGGLKEALSYVPGLSPSVRVLLRDDYMPDLSPQELQTLLAISIFDFLGAGTLLGSQRLSSTPLGYADREFQTQRNEYLRLLSYVFGLSVPLSCTCMAEAMPRPVDIKRLQCLLLQTPLFSADRFLDLGRLLQGRVEPFIDWALKSVRDASDDSLTFLQFVRLFYREEPTLFQRLGLGDTPLETLEPWLQGRMDPINDNPSYGTFLLAVIRLRLIELDVCRLLTMECNILHHMAFENTGFAWVSPNTFKIPAHEEEVTDICFALCSRCSKAVTDAALESGVELSARMSAYSLLCDQCRKIQRHKVIQPILAYDASARRRFSQLFRQKLSLCICPEDCIALLCASGFITSGFYIHQLAHEMAFQENSGPLHQRKGVTPDACLWRVHTPPHSDIFGMLRFRAIGETMLSTALFAARYRYALALLPSIPLDDDRVYASIRSAIDGQQLLHLLRLYAEDMKVELFDKEGKRIGPVSTTSSGAWTKALVSDVNT
ncbi:putative membrane spanning protein [Giardia muris]|uniref:Putative membrane spanning protein n=1 Tax=Giardia muris TaxID=5742 RepID=A0A4Z1SSX3_GIAMU|nr:putative membrane spanning protein [Giardia muris]|eukprot:TNJ26748.1 putative membrane spanning protein [Giardia muris]